MFKPTLGLMLLHSVSKLLQFLWTFTAQSEMHTHKKVLIILLSCLGKGIMAHKGSLILEEVQSKLRCCGKHPGCACSGLDFIPNPGVFSVRLHHWVQFTHVRTKSHSRMHEQFSAPPPLSGTQLSSSLPRPFPCLSIQNWHPPRGQQFFGSTGIAAFLHGLLLGAAVTTVN